MPSMVVLVLHDMEHFSDLMARWHDAGAPAVTILESLGTRDLKDKQAMRDLPMMPTVRDVMQADDVPRTTVFTVVQDEVVDRLAEVTEEVLGDLSEPGKGIFFVLPASRVIGLRGLGDEVKPT